VGPPEHPLYRFLVDAIDVQQGAKDLMAEQIRQPIEVGPEWKRVEAAVCGEDPFAR